VSPQCQEKGREKEDHVLAAAANDVAEEAWDAVADAAAQEGLASSSPLLLLQVVGAVAAAAVAEAADTSAAVAGVAAAGSLDQGSPAAGAAAGAGGAAAVGTDAAAAAVAAALLGVAAAVGVGSGEDHHRRVEVDRTSSSLARDACELCLYVSIKVYVRCIVRQKGRKQLCRG